MPAFAGLLKLPIYVDSLILKNKKIYIGSGEYESSFRILISQYVKIEAPVKGVFSKAKK